MISPSTIAAEHLSQACSREQLILEHLPQVRLIAKRIHRNLPPSVSLEDLVSAGTVGLIAAVSRYDASRGVKLKTYAEYKVRGAILDSLRTLDWAPRQQRSRVRVIEAAISTLENENGRIPDDEEVAARLGLPLKSYQTWLAHGAGLTLGRLEQPSAEEGGRDLLRYVGIPEEEWPSEVFERAELRSLLAASVEEVPPHERTVLTLYFYEGMTLREIAKIMNLHESRVSQLKSQAIVRLRVRLRHCQPAHC
jgi:RNA polymerase sigma factor for flagellar operon FliA